jgi:DnaJ homolog subfamily B member 12
MRFENEVSPEELFNMFFGGGFSGGGTQFGGPFGGANGMSLSLVRPLASCPTCRPSCPNNAQISDAVCPDIACDSIVYTFGANGFQRANLRGARRRQAADDQPRQPATLKSTIFQLLPIILFFLMSFGGAIWNILFAERVVPDPDFRFYRSAMYDQERTTTLSDILGRSYPIRGGVAYFVNKGQWKEHPTLRSTVPIPGEDPDRRALARFELKIEKRYLELRYDMCARAIERRERAMDAKRGLFGIGADWEGIKKLKEEKIEACEEVRRWGVRVEY